MALKHTLSLEVADTNNVNIIKIFDTSLYSSELGVDCPLLQVTAPGFTLPANISVSSNFNITLSACDLGIQLTNCNTPAPLPDGVYIIRYSVSPNDKVFVEYTYLRVTVLLEEYNKQLCQLELSSCEPQADVKESLKELRLIKSFIDAAKAKVEYCNDTNAGMNLYKYAKSRLDKYPNLACNSCN
jgi:hypothetical protein